MPGHLVGVHTKPMIRQARVYIIGDVIGVGFRAWTVIQAKKFGVKGWVRNVYDKPEIFGVEGGVEALLQAEEIILNQMIEKLKEGPQVTTVDNVKVINENVTTSFKYFEILK